MELIDFASCEPLPRFYGGNAGRKISVLLDGAPWMLKFPESTKGFKGKHLASYTTSPLSEYIGSHLYEALGIPVHETRLGIYEGKVVVGCKDFAVDDRLFDFASIKNSVSEDSLESGSNSSSGKGELLHDALKVIETAPAFEKLRDDALERFWDMFVVDSVILNNDRNNGNWGVLVKRYSIELAPVFDNGNAFFNKKNNSILESALATPKGLLGDINAYVSYFTDSNRNSIHPFNLMREHSIADLDKAIDRFAERFDPEAVDKIISEIPESFLGIEVISEVQRKAYRKALSETTGIVLPLSTACRSEHERAGLTLDELEAFCCSEPEGAAAPGGEAR